MLVFYYALKIAAITGRIIPMRVFVSSRMTDESQAARRSVIEAIHIAGQRVLYIETEEYNTHPQMLMQTMISMAERADFFVGVYPAGSKKGVVQGLLNGKSPIEFELYTMISCFIDAGLADKIPSHFLLLYQAGADIGWIEELLRGQNLAPQPNLLSYDAHTDLISVIYDTFSRFPPQSRTSTSDYTVAIEYRGSNHPGLLQAISEHLFSRYGMNVDHVWASREGENALLHLVASWNKGARTPPSEDKARKDLKDAIESRLTTRIRKRDLSLRITGPPGHEEALGYFDLRVIDAPGQLNTICKAVRKLDLDISRIRLAPAPPEFQRQTIITLELPLGKDSGKSIWPRYLLLESILRDLIGVRAMASRLTLPDTLT